MPAVNLTYNIAEARLSGSFGGAVIDCAAVSGGRAGTTTKGAGNWYLQNNALATCIHHGGDLFGPLPMGLYAMYPHESKKNMVRLEPFPSNYMFGRSGFLIHGRGKIGSHGCIVPGDPKDLHAICAAVANFIKLHRTRPVLEVIAVGGNIDDKFFTA